MSFAGQITVAGFLMSLGTYMYLVSRYDETDPLYLITKLPLQHFLVVRMLVAGGLSS